MKIKNNLLTLFSCFFLTITGCSKGKTEQNTSEHEHQFVDTVVAPTYESDGYTKHTCSICGYSYNDSKTDKFSHNFTQTWAYDESKHWHSCSDEGYENVKGDEADHTFVDEVTLILPILAQAIPPILVRFVVILTLTAKQIN